MQKNRICELLGIKYPIIQGAMAWISNGNLAGHVSKAGGLGIIAGGGMPPEILRQEIRKAKSITDNPFGVNLMLMMESVAEQIDVCIEEGVKVVTTGAGNPGVYMEKLKSAGIKVIPVVASVALAKRMEKIGADAVVAEGLEAGGHIGEITTMALATQVAREVSIPVIVAGGIASGEQFLAALALGGEGVQVGTIFIVAHECDVHENYKRLVLKAKDRSTVTTGNYTGHPVRVLNNKFSKAILELEVKGAPKEEIEELGKGKLRLAVVDGDVENGSVMSGQVAGLVKEELSCQEIIDKLMTELKEEKVKLDERVSTITF
ncbi:nitronate monooxygenase [Candidatus Cetobacterium colombiensis]|uniref:Nitronate monooxygenase n=1 Tax=Candidatus Cetobacterium colombiensis TaxID=3073100 RepID=A0ABU4W781_9FUSO|nr:nitronate monooxygenase [Candidatus Cetobacterium colombiensis]MDX8335045.1 nitronate monooxygenase [Candidatus Cetobacterium colombiensis]